MYQELRRDVLNALSRKREVERTVSSVSSIVIIPLVSAVLGAYTTDIETKFGKDVYFAIWTVIAILLCTFAVRANVSGRGLLALALANESLENELAISSEREGNLQSAINSLAFQAGYAASSRSIVLQHAKSKIADLEGLKAAIGDIASPVSYRGEYLFGLMPNEAWSFAVYVYSKDRDLLVPVWRDKARAHPSLRDNLGREWGRGEGHVGKAFVDQKPIITGDAFDPEAAQFSTVPPGKDKTYDRSSYVSFASVPIGPILARDGRPYGVLVATSDRAGRFDRDNAGILVQIAGAVAAFLIIGGLNIDNLSPNRPVEPSGDGGMANGDLVAGESGGP